MLGRLKSYWWTVSLWECILKHKTILLFILLQVLPSLSWSPWLETLEEISWSDVTSSLWNDCKFRTAGSGWSFLNCCKRNAEPCYCWCFYRKQNKNSSDSELDFFKAVFKTQIFKCLTWKVTFLPRMYTVIQVGFFSLHWCSRLSQLGECVLSVSRRTNAVGCSKASWTLLCNLVWFGFHIFKCNCESKKAVRLDNIFL